MRRAISSVLWFMQMSMASNSSVAGQLRDNFRGAWADKKGMYGGKRPAECVLIFPLSRLCTVSRANGVEGYWYAWPVLFLPSVARCGMVQVLLPGNEGLYFPFVVFYKLVVGLPSDDEIGCSGDK